MPAFNVRLRHLPSGLIDQGMQCGWRCFSRVLQADAEAFHRRFNYIRTFKPAGRREYPRDEEPVRRKLSLHGPGKHVVSAVAAIDAGIYKSSASRTTREAREDRTESSVLAGPSTHMERWKYSGLLCASGFASGITDTVPRLRPAEDVINFRKKTPAMKTSRRITNALQIYMMWSLKREQTSRCDRE